MAAVLVAATVATIAYVRYRQSESSQLARDAELAAALRSAAGDDAVRRAAVEEFEVRMYQRLFYSSVIGPHCRSAAWSLLTAFLATAGVLVLRGSDDATVVVIWVVMIVAAVAFAVAALSHLGLAVYAALVTPRVSFAESYASDEE